MAELFEKHDKSKFELYAFSFGPDIKDPMRARVEAAFDQFIDVTTMSDKEIAMFSRMLQIDIAIDLKGATKDHRFGIFSHRAAPIQVSYLGYPGTMGAEYIDYLIADKTLIPTESQKFYTEKIAYMPHSYQVNDRSRVISERVFTKQEVGLPEEGFVFACFNNNYKITPDVFDVWMRILKSVEGSVLWVYQDNETAALNLRKEAQKRGVVPERLVFAPKIEKSEHLARHKLADLFIDTLPINAHTTASDALWAGLPVLTCLGESFASRVAGSLLNAIGMPELITTSHEEYEALAITLGNDPQRIKAMKQKLEHNKLTTPLFDSTLFTKNIENLYEQMWKRDRDGMGVDCLTSALNLY
jgi:predicted O-linked N-acetylglucosamine transferase (SPINDLY family)